MLYSFQGRRAVCLAVSLITAGIASAMVHDKMVHVKDKRDLGTIRQGNTGTAFASAVSRNGRIVGGQANIKVAGQYSYLKHAVLWNFSGKDWPDDTDDTPGTKDLGTLNDVNGESWINDLSGDGSIAAGASQYKKNSKANHDIHAAIWTSSDKWKTWQKHDLGTLMKNNEGESRVKALSGNGSIAGGYADAYSPPGDSSTYSHAAIWTSSDHWKTWQKHDLGTLNDQSAADSKISALSEEGNIAGGYSNYDTSGHNHAAIWTSSDKWKTWQKQDLGTLKGDNSGDSYISALSDDGKVAGGSASYSDAADKNNIVHAAIWVRSDKKYAKGIDLGTLKSNNAGRSGVNALSADGNVAGGWSSYGESSEHATIWRSSDHWKNVKHVSKRDLGTLRKNNSGDSYVNALSADGTVAVGQAVNEKNELRAVLWNLRYDNKPVEDQNSLTSVKQLVEDSFNFMDQQTVNLGRLQDGCAITRDARFCTSFAGVGSGVGGVSINGKAIGASDLYSYAQAAFGYAFTKRFASGVSVSTGVGKLPPGDLKPDGISPGVGLWARWREATRDGYWYLRGSAAGSVAKIRRTRIGAGIEFGQGTSTSNAWGVTSEFGRVHDYDFANKIRVRYYGGLRQNDVHLSGYTETRAPKFPFSWTGATSSQTDVYIGIRYRMSFGKAFYGAIQAELQQDLLHKDPTSIAYAKYFGNVVCDSDVAPTRATLSASLSYAVSDAVVVSFNPFIQDSVTDQTVYGAMVQISGTF